MPNYADKQGKNTRVAHSNPRKQKTRTETFQFQDNRLKTLQLKASQRASSAQHAPLQFVDNRAQSIRQREIQSLLSGGSKKSTIQLKGDRDHSTTNDQTPTKTQNSLTSTSSNVIQRVVSKDLAPGTAVKIIKGGLAGRVREIVSKDAKKGGYNVQMTRSTRFYDYASLEEVPAAGGAVAAEPDLVGDEGAADVEVAEAPVLDRVEVPPPAAAAASVLVAEPMAASPAGAILPAAAEEVEEDAPAAGAGLHFNHVPRLRRLHNQKIATDRSGSIRSFGAREGARHNMTVRNQQISAQDASTMREAEDSGGFMFAMQDDTIRGMPKPSATSKFHHSTLFGIEQEVDMAGHIKVGADGKIDEIDPYSGHFKPSGQHLLNALHRLNGMGLIKQDTRVRVRIPHGSAKFRIRQNRNGEDYLEIKASNGQPAERYLMGKKGDAFPASVVSGMSQRTVNLLFS